VLFNTLGICTIQGNTALTRITATNHSLNASTNVRNRLNKIYIPPPIFILRDYRGVFHVKHCGVGMRTFVWVGGM